MRIIYQNDENAAVLIPAPQFLSSLPSEWTEDQRLTYIADKDLPTGTKYEIVADTDIPADRSERAAWQYVSGPNEKTSQDLT